MTREKLEEDRIRELEDSHRQHRQALEKQATCEQEIAMLRGQVHGSITATLESDKVYQDAIRARAWLRHNPSLRITIGDGDSLSGVPEGWPPTVEDPEELVRQDIATRRDAHIDDLFGQRATSASQPVRESPSVSRLKEMVEKLNGGGGS